MSGLSITEIIIPFAYKQVQLIDNLLIVTTSLEGVEAETAIKVTPDDSILGIQEKLIEALNEESNLILQI